MAKAVLPQPQDEMTQFPQTLKVGVWEGGGQDLCAVPWQQADLCWVLGWVKTGLYSGCSKGPFLLRRQAALALALPPLSPAQDTGQRMTLVWPNEWHQNRARCPWFQCYQQQGQVTQPLGASWADTVPRESPCAHCHTVSMCTLPHGIVPFSKQNSPSSQHKRQPHRKRAAGAHLIPLCGQPLRKHIQVSNMKDTLWVWLKSGMKTNLGYIHHHPQSRAGICYFSYRKVCGGFNEQHGEIRARHVHNHTFLRSPRNHR